MTTKLATFFASLEAQKQTLTNLINHYQECSDDKNNLSHAVQLLSEADFVLVTGMGKSGKVGDKIAATLSSTGTPAVFVNPGEASHGDLGIASVFKNSQSNNSNTNIVIVAISNSGETKELADTVKYAEKHYMPLISITAGKNNTLARHATVPLVTAVEKETACPIAKAPMNSTTATLVLGDALAAELMTLHAFSEQDFKDTHPGGSLGDELATVDEQMVSGEKMPIVYLDQSVRDSLAEKRQKSLGCCIVCNNKMQPVGIFTDGMYSRFLEEGISIDGKAVEELMKKEPKTLPLGTSIKDAVSFMEASSINHIPIVNSAGKVVGVYTFHSRVK